MGEWEGAPVDYWRGAWDIPELLVFREVRSTNDIVRARALAGSPAGATAIADHQSAGRGRLGRAWVAPAGQALLLSVLFRPASDGPPEAAGAIPIRVGLALAAALHETTGVRVAIKWPNDVLADGGKLAGILCEAAAGFVVVGIGVNVHQQRPDFPSELGEAATSVRLLTGAGCSRADLAGAIVACLRPWFQAPGRPLDPSELSQFAALDALAGSPITIDHERAGTAAGIDPRGALIVVGPRGRRTHHAGTVRRIT